MARSPRNPHAGHKKPLWAFGWRGWTALVILFALIAWMATGRDVREDMFTLIRATLGDEAMIQFVYAVLIPHHWDWDAFQASFFMGPRPRFGLLAGVITAVAIAIHPSRGSLWALGAIACGALVPPGEWLLMVWLREAGWSDHPAAWHISWGVGCVVVLVFCAAAFRRWWLTMILGLLLAAGLDYYVRASSGQRQLGGSFYFTIWAYRLWYPAFALAVIASAIIIRRGGPAPFQCPQCRYDLRGARADRCPECGREVEKSDTDRPPLRAR